MRRVFQVVLAILIAQTWCPAQATGTSPQEAIRLLVQQVQELQAKVNALEAKQGVQPGAHSDPSTQPRPLEESASAPALPTTFPHELLGIQWRGFGEVDYKVVDQRTPELGAFGFVPGSAANFYAGDFDLFLTSRISDRASVLAEVVFGEQDAQSFQVDLERVLFKYDYNDRLRMSFGRYHTAIGYYNTAYHSGRWLQTATNRP